MDLYLIQMAIARGKPPLNRAKATALTAPLKPAADDLVILPELFSTGYLDETALAVGGGPGAAPSPDSAGPNGAQLAPVAGEDRAFLSGLARKLGCWIAGTTVEAGPPREEGGGYRNLSLLFAPDGSERAAYRKIHPFSYGGEERLFAPGREIVTADLGPWIVQPTICYDLRFPELYRAGSARGAHLVLVQANWPEARQAHWRALLQARAIENQAFVAGVNCAGTQGPLVYAGGSAVFSPKGETIAEAGSAETVLRARIDLDGCKRWRKQFPALRDRVGWDLFAP